VPSRIKVLSDELIGKIAAGEVIENPAAVIKELVENSLDAGATEIQVTVGHSVLEEISVSDNGCGILPDELPLAVTRYATSKIGSYEELERLSSLGFRGEALPSIAQVSKLRITSKAAGVEEAAVLEVDGGDVGRVLEGARDNGTTVTVRELFFNAPVRRKFQRSEASELRQIQLLVSRFALAFPSVAFSLVKAGKAVLEFHPGEDLRSRVVRVWGRIAEDEILEFSSSGSDISTHGFVSKPEVARSNRMLQSFFVNGRWVQSFVLSKAVYAAYEGILPPDRHPAFTVFIEIDPAWIDVNIHPTKREIRFARPWLMERRLTEAVSQVIEAPRGAISTIPFPTLVKEKARGYPSSKALPQELRLSREGAGKAVEGRTPGAVGVQGQSYGVHPPEEQPPFFQLHRSYIIASIRDGYIILDQHAAHERILYEHLMTSPGFSKGGSQKLLFPIVVKLPSHTASELGELESLLKRIGFAFTVLDKSSVRLEAIPSTVRQGDEARTFRDMLEELWEGKRPPASFTYEEVARSFACHAAIKAGQQLSAIEMKELIDKLFATENPQSDPHGRPTYIRYSLDELTKKFGR